MTATVLIVDDLPSNRILLAARLAAACYRVVQTAGAGVGAGVGAGAGAWAAAQPDLIVAGADRPGAAALIARLRAEAAGREVPLLALAAGPAARIAALDAGADAAETRAGDEGVFRARLRGLLRDRPPPEGAQVLAGLAEAPTPFAAPAQVALLSPHPCVAAGWRAALAPHLGAHLSCPPPADALAAADLPGAPDLYLIADGAGALLADLRARTGDRAAALAVAPPAWDAAAAAQALDLGAGEVLPPDVPVAEAAARLRALIARKRRADALRAAVQRGLALAAVDPLTGLWNRRHALPAFARMAAGLQGCAVLLVDIDRFKAVNDGHGHDAGDAVLTEVARRLRAAAGAEALVARIGGEEFLVALPAATTDGARAAAERLRLAVGGAPVPLPGGGALAVTVSVGLALAATAAPWAELFACADRALRAAKADGRNQVTVSVAA